MKITFSAAVLAVAVLSSPLASGTSLPASTSALTQIDANSVSSVGAGLDDCDFRGQTGPYYDMMNSVDLYSDKKTDWYTLIMLHTSIHNLKEAMMTNEDTSTISGLRDTDLLTDLDSALKTMPCKRDGWKWGQQKTSIEGYFLQKSVPRYNKRYEV